VFSCDMATWVSWQSAACVRGNPADGLPAPTYTSMHDSERQDDTLFRWFRIGRNNSHTDLPVVHRRQPVPACFIYERLMNRFPLRSVKTRKLSRGACERHPSQSVAKLRQETRGSCWWEEFSKATLRCWIQPNKRWIWTCWVNGGCKHRAIVSWIMFILKSIMIDGGH